MTYAELTWNADDVLEIARNEGVRLTRETAADLLRENEDKLFEVCYYAGAEWIKGLLIKQPARALEMVGTK